MPDDGIVLLSGGLDSAVTLAIAKRECGEVHALTVRYGQRHAVELSCARAVARSLGVASHRVLDVDLSSWGGSSLIGGGPPVPKDRSEQEIVSAIPSTYVPARNTVLLALALSCAEAIGAGAIYIGVHAEDGAGYPDTRPEYLEAFRRLAALATRRGVEGRGIEVRAPLLACNKAAIVSLGRELQVDFALTSSCYDPLPDGSPCGRCDACSLRAKGFREAGFSDPPSRRS
ncbi:MAG: 7-cyano-7-deazaguanine synthase QueC [Candidatus Eisenbacteria bacterium]|nr:7-cyano-7-deazaguanine synthase QueC [Candidatus Eisenbacteria bacterium]